MKKAYDYCQDFIQYSTANNDIAHFGGTAYTIDDCNIIDSEWNNSQWKSDEDEAEHEKEQKLLQEQKDFIAKVAKEPYPPK